MEKTGTIKIINGSIPPEMAGGEGSGQLILIDAFDNITEYHLDSFGRTRLYIGRNKEQNDIVVNSSIVSGSHGKLKLDNGRVLYADLDSTNGTIIDSDGYRRMLRGNRRYYELKSGDLLRVEATKGPAEKQSVMLLYEGGSYEGSWRRFPLLAQSTSIGRDDKNDIVLNHPAVSRFHAVINRHGEEVFLSDENSANGVYVNGRRVTGRVRLHQKDAIRIANHTLIFTNGTLFYKSSAQGINIEVRDVNKVVGRERKKILDDVSCTIESNEFVAIVGGSGAGKTTLMNAISGFDRRFTGSVCFNGIDVAAHFNDLKDLIGFVPQEDIIYENLTLRKMLYYTAKLKMPADIPPKEIEKRIEQVLDMVELSEHQNTYIRKLSGGQKKRASIAVELLADPSVFFLDEPTSGLDPGTEQKLMITLNKLSKSQGKTIVMVTHTTQSLQLCDKVIFMGRGGRLCFCGTTEQAKMFFDTDDLVNIYNMITDEPELWASQFRACMENDRLDQEEGFGSLEKEKKSLHLSQLAILIRRYFELIRNDLQRLGMLLLQPVAIALLLTVVANENSFYIYDDTKSMLFCFSCAGIWIGLFNSIQEICKERAILKREYMGNLRLSLYIASKFLVQTVIGAVQALLMTAIFYFMVGHPQEGICFSTSFPETVITLWMTIEASMALGFVISSLVKNTDRAMTLAPFVLIVQLLFSGILFKLEGLGDKIAFLTVSKWSVEALGSLAVLNDLPRLIQKSLPTAGHEAELIFVSTAGHEMLTWGIMLGMTLACAVVCTILLRQVAKDTR